jgi:NADH dehydrogenase
VAWLFVHIMYLAKFENRLLVLIQWFWNYVSRNRTARLITGQHALDELSVRREATTPEPALGPPVSSVKTRN